MYSMILNQLLKIYDINVLKHVYIYIHDLCMNAHQFYHNRLPRPLHGEQR